MGKTQSLTAVIVAAAVAMTACGGGGTGAAEQKELSVWFNDPGPKLQETVKGLISGFEKANPGVKVSLRFIGGADTHQQFVTAIAGGAPPCVATLGNTWTPEFAQMGALAPVDLTPEQAKQKFVGSMVDSVTNDGKIYGYPYNVANRALVYRKDLLEKSGLDVPKTWDETKAAAAKLAADNKAEGIAGFGIVGGEIWYYLPMVWNWGGEIATQQDGKWTATMNTPQAKAAFDFYASMVRDDKVAPAESAGWLGPDAVKSLGLGKVAMGLFGPWQIKQLVAEKPELKEQLGVALIPSGPSGNNDTFAGGSNLVVFNQCQAKAEATALLHYMVQPQNVTQYTSGIGMLPAALDGMKAEAETGSFADDLFRPFVEQAQHTRYIPTDPGWGRIEGKGSIINAMQALIGGKSDVNTTMSDLNTEMNAAFGG
ncbi:sugar ABC transporter substrate-binding protein [Nonomuraea antimicrobica]|uniref:Sugar ABC transporter substrate-binding protein n=1 Tax=Nonomuraea antimicrobica TaxID=561173 RepID=A0ABP7B1Z6_9ACTN